LTGPQVQRVDRRTDDVFDDRQTPFRRDNDALRGEDAVGDACAVLLEQYQRRRQLPDQGCGERGTARLVQDLGQPFPGAEIRDQRQVIVWLEPLDGAHRGERGVPELAEPTYPLAQRSLEPLSLREVGAEAEQLEGRGVAVVEHQQTVAEPVGQPLRIPARQRLGCRGRQPLGVLRIHPLWHSLATGRKAVLSAHPRRGRSGEMRESATIIRSPLIGDDTSGGNHVGRQKSHNRCPCAS
jgi:hypothetical protein